MGKAGSRWCPGTSSAVGRALGYCRPPPWPLLSSGGLAVGRPGPHGAGAGQLPRNARHCLFWDGTSQVQMHGGRGAETLPPDGRREKAPFRLSARPTGCCDKVTRDWGPRNNSHSPRCSVARTGLPCVTSGPNAVTVACHSQGNGGEPKGGC